MWHDKMTSADFDRNLRSWQDQQRREAKHLRVLSAQYLREAERIEATLPRPASTKGED